MAWTKSNTTKHTCGGVHFGHLAPKNTCPRCDELHMGEKPVVWNTSAKRDADRCAEIRAHNCADSHCGTACTFGEW